MDVLIADDHPLYRSGVKTLLESAGACRVVGEARTGGEAVALAGRLRPHVVLMDVNLPDISGIEATRAIVGRCPDTAVVVVTMLEDRDTFLSAMRSGARGYLLKGADSKELRRAIDVVHAGSVLFDSHVADWVVEYLTKPPAAQDPFPELTARERAVLELVADGKGNAVIARELGLSVKTVRNYLSRIFAKLRLVDRTEAAVLARRAGLGR
ncbi:response regulator [Actinokineospora enzanensis]|uniref:response regulator n=1 Tax=Actinokineospora enzanensis TaxID=155975 RepID=UPI00035F8089